MRPFDTDSQERKTAVGEGVVDRPRKTEGRKKTESHPKQHRVQEMADHAGMKGPRRRVALGSRGNPQNAGAGIRCQ